MTKADWGIKRNCLSCPTKFYDFNRKPILCPSCGKELVLEKPERIKAKKKNGGKSSKDSSPEKKIIENNDKDVSIIFTTRKPLSSINSPVKNWLNYEKGINFFPQSLYFHLDLAFKGLDNLVKLKKKIYIIQLEKLHWEHKKVMNDFCKIFNIKYEKCLEKPTFFGLQWWGDKISKRWVSGINKNFKITIDKKFFFPRDIQFFENLASDIIRFYKYNFFYNDKKKIYFNLLPMKCEILVWKNTFKHKKIKHILSIPYFYLKRIFLINNFFITNKNFPYSVGSKK